MGMILCVFFETYSIVYHPEDVRLMPTAGFFLVTDI